MSNNPAEKQPEINRSMYGGSGRYQFNNQFPGAWSSHRSRFDDRFMEECFDTRVRLVIPQCDEMHVRNCPPRGERRVEKSSTSFAELFNKAIEEFETRNK